MNSTSRKVLAVIFIVLIAAVGVGTLYNAKSDIRKMMNGRSKQGYRSDVESAILNNFAKRTDWINLNGLFNKCMGTTIVRDPEYTVYKLSDGQIMYSLPERDMTKYAAYVTRLKTALDKTDTDFIYIQIPFKIKDDSYMPAGTHANGNENADQMVELLRKEGINTMDLRDNIEAAGLNWSDLYYNTDHHWRETTAFWAAGEIFKRLKEDYGIEYNEDYCDESNYEKTYYNNYMLGTVGRRTGIYYAGLDDFVLYNPKFDTDFSYKAYKKKLSKVSAERDGNFWDTMYEWSNLEMKADFEKNTYSTYTGREYGLVHIDNKKIENGPKILMIRESFTCALLPFLAVNADEVMTIDLRRYKERTVPEVCEEFKPDIVIMDYNPSAFSKEQFDFFGDF